MRRGHRHAPALAEHMVVATGESSSYTVVINPPGVDRCFLHHTGTNDTFVASDLTLDVARSGRLLHFGYPPLMKQTFVDGGRQFAQRWAEFEHAGVLTSLDMAMPDPESEAGKVDWPNWLQQALAHVDIFLPSLDEVLLMTDPERYERLIRSAGPLHPAAAADADLLSSISDQLLQFGASIVGLKLGDQGLYLRTADDVTHLAKRRSWENTDWTLWNAREMIVPCFDVEVVGTTGSGDCTVAGFLAGLIQGLDPVQTARRAVAVGACNVEGPDATSGIPPMKDVASRLQGNWASRPLAIDLAGWQQDVARGVWYGPHDPGPSGASCL